MLIRKDGWFYVCFKHEIRILIFVEENEQVVQRPLTVIIDASVLDKKEDCYSIEVSQGASQKYVWNKDNEWYLIHKCMYVFIAEF